MRKNAAKRKPDTSFRIAWSRSSSRIKWGVRRPRISPSKPTVSGRATLTGSAVPARCRFWSVHVFNSEARKHRWPSARAGSPCHDCMPSWHGHLARAPWVGPNGAFRYVPRPAVRGRPKPRLLAEVDYWGSKIFATQRPARLASHARYDVVSVIFPKFIARRGDPHVICADIPSARFTFPPRSQTSPRHRQPGCRCYMSHAKGGRGLPQRIRREAATRRELWFWE